MANNDKYIGMHVKCEQHQCEHIEIGANNYENNRDKH